jgi:hypothetical protein
MRRSPWPLVAGLVLALLGSALALDTPNERVTLAGLTGVHVVVDQPSPEAERQGPTLPGLQAEVEGRLRRSGLRVLSASEALKVAGRPTLHLRLELVRSRDAPSLFVYSVDLALRQQTQLMRDRTIEAYTITWSDTRQVGAVDAAGLDVVRDVVRAKVD